MSTGEISIPVQPQSAVDADAMRVDALETFALGHPVFLGAGLGLVWGILMRGWMRFISSSPEFSWSGTFFILAASVIVGSVLGFARKRRMVGGVGWWRISVLSMMLLGAGGAVMWPSVIAGGLAIGRPRPRWLRVGLAIIAIAVQVIVLRSVFEDNATMSMLAKVVAVAWYAPLITVEAWAFSVVFAPSVDDARTPSKVKRVLIAIPFVAITAMAAAAVGVPG